MSTAALFDKPRDRDEAAEHLRAFSGRTMLLSSAVALASDGRVDWSHAETARLDVRPLSDAFIQSYLDAEWPEVGYCVGVFRMEGRGRDSCSTGSRAAISPSSECRCCRCSARCASGD